LQNREYYYFVATLPWLNYGDKPPVSSQEFRERCYEMLHQEDAKLIRFCSYDPRLAIETVESTGSDFIDLLLARERTLILNLASLRAARLEWPFTEEPSHNVPRAEALAKAAFEMNDPLEAEIYIDQARWGALDALVGIDYFGVNNIYAFLLKLQLLERKQCFNTERGTAGYKERYDSVLNEYNSKVRG
jgi:hypothetical protein